MRLAVLFALTFGTSSQSKTRGRDQTQTIALLSRVVLAGAYFISVSYYLQLLAAFVLNAVNLEGQALANSVTTMLLVVIGGIGMWRGLRMLENLEKYCVALNLGMVGGLLIGLALYNVDLWFKDAWTLPSISSKVDFTTYESCLACSLSFKVSKPLAISVMHTPLSSELLRCVQPRSFRR